MRSGLALHQSSPVDVVVDLSPIKGCMNAENHRDKQIFQNLPGLSSIGVERYKVCDYKKPSTLFQESSTSLIPFPRVLS